jgi:hypothetical protein
MTKLCPRGKAAAKRKFRVYPSAYANAYASKICAGKIKDPSGVKRKDFKGRKPAAAGGQIKQSNKNNKKTNSIELIKKRKDSKKEALEKIRKELGMKGGGRVMKKEGGMGRPVSKRPLPIRGSRREKVSREMNEKLNEQRRRELSLINAKPPKSGPRSKPRPKMMGGGLMEATQRLRRQGLRGGGLCKRGMNRDAIGKNS